MQRRSRQSHNPSGETPRSRHDDRHHAQMAHAHGRPRGRRRQTGRCSCLILDEQRAEQLQTQVWCGCRLRTLRRVSRAGARAGSPWRRAAHRICHRRFCRPPPPTRHHPCHPQQQHPRPRRGGRCSRRWLGALAVPGMTAILLPLLVMGCVFGGTSVLVPAAFDYPAHALSLVPIADWPLWAFRRRASRKRPRYPAPQVRKALLDQITREGPLPIRRLRGATESGAGWDWGPTHRRHPAAQRGVEDVDSPRRPGRLLRRHERPPPRRRLQPLGHLRILRHPRRLASGPRSDRRDLHQRGNPLRDRTQQRPPAPSVRPAEEDLDGDRRAVQRDRRNQGQPLHRRPRPCLRVPAHRYTGSWTPLSTP